jgi:ribosome-binding protein aMBF1 (putative translation factor)
MVLPKKEESLLKNLRWQFNEKDYSERVQNNARSRWRYDMSRKTTTDAVRILQHRLKRDPKLAILVEEELRRLKLAEQIHDARREAGLSQKQLADKMGTSQSAIARLEKGDYGRSTIRTLTKVSHVLNRRLKVELEPA